MDYLSFLGVFLALGAILLGNQLDGGAVGSLLNVPAAIIVLGGTLGATLLQFPFIVFARSMQMLKWVFQPEPLNLSMNIKKVVNWSTLARKEGLLGLENEMLKEKDAFVKKGLQLLVDGNEPEVIRDILEVELVVKEERELQSTKIFEAMGGYAPTIGILGAVMGLIHVMQNLADPKLLGEGIATAFVATIYGVATANLIFLPIANKLKAQVLVLSQAKELMIEGIVCIAQGENPRNIELKLNGYLHDNPKGK
ncbi:MAG: flagellar motor protein [Methylobacter sp.]|nr:MAG: flagellar motor protein [Methylobacter sp.]